MYDKELTHWKVFRFTKEKSLRSPSVVFAAVPVCISALCHEKRHHCMQKAIFVKRSAIWWKQAKTSEWHKYLSVFFRRHTSDHYDKKVCHCPMWVTARCEAHMRKHVHSYVWQHHSDKTRQTVTASPSAPCGCLAMRAFLMLISALVGTNCIAAVRFVIHLCQKKGLKLNWKPFPVIAGNGTPSSKRNRCIRV